MTYTKYYKTGFYSETEVTRDEYLDNAFNEGELRYISKDYCSFCNTEINIYKGCDCEESKI